MKLAQNTVENGPEAALMLGEASTAFSVVGFIFAAIPILILIAFAVLWLFALIDVLRRPQSALKEKKILHVILIVLIGFVGVPFYFFMEGRKKWGIVTVVLYGVLPLILALYAISAFVLNSSSY